MPHRFMTLIQVADYLHLSPGDVESLVKQGELPAEKLGDKLSFRTREIESWASQRIMGLTDKRLSAHHQVATRKANHGVRRVMELIKPEYVHDQLHCKTRPSAIRDMAELAGKTGLVFYPEDLHKSLRDREELCSTAMPGGVALLHPRHHDPYMVGESLVLLGRSLQAIPFGAPDRGQTDLFFLILCTDDRLHLHVLARLCMMLTRTEVGSQLRSAESASEMYQHLVAAEETVCAGLGNS